ncbi:MAG: hypothetical protein QOG15_264 [Solirubrobacteraceae bacterium]|nr:hypothetical protein [Solirubrobacteraceae bacterium]
MRILFTAHGAYGHVFPMVAAAHALARAGHDVTVATAKNLCPTVSSLGLRAVAAGIDDVSMVAEARRRWPETEHEPPAKWAVRMFTDIAAPAMITSLQSVLADTRPELIVREEGEHGGPVAAATAGIPWATHGWGSPRPPLSTRDALARAVTPLWHAAGLPAPRASDLDGIGVLDPCPPSLYGDDAPLSAHSIRPETPATSSGANFRVSTAERPLAYVGFGTVPLYRDRPELITEIAEALLARGFDPIITTPDPQLTRRLVSLAPGRVHVQQWLSLPKTLQACALVACHGGAGTVLAALAAGIPLLLLPQGAPSQARMSHACQLRGVARVLDSRAADASTLDDAVHALTGDQYHTTAQQLAAEIAAMPRADHAVTAIQTLLRP